MIKQVVLFSGGLDSATLLVRFKPQHTIALGFDYGQPHRIELEYAQRFCGKRGFEYRVCTLDIPKSGLTNPHDPSPVVHGRNTIFLAYGCATAFTVKAARVYIGINHEDREVFPDCRPAYLSAFNAVQRAQGGPQVHAPLAYSTKAFIAVEARKSGIDLSEVWSCYSPQNKKPCGACIPCTQLAKLEE